MTKDEMQRFLDRESRKGSTEYEALQALAEVIGIVFHPAAAQTDQPKENGGAA